MPHSALLSITRLVALLTVAGALGGCTVIAVGGLAVDAAVGAVKLTGKAVGAAVDLVIPDGDEKK